MTNFKGTPGKWKLRISDSFGIDVEQQKTGFCIINLGTYKDLQNADYAVETAKYNALLISKAPEMLEMLVRVNKKLLSLGGKNTPLRIEIEELIKEATEL